MKQINLVSPSKEVIAFLTKSLRDNYVNLRENLKEELSRARANEKAINGLIKRINALTDLINETDKQLDMLEDKE